MKYFLIGSLIIVLQACCNLNTQQLGSRDIISAPPKAAPLGLFELPWYQCQRIEVTQEKIITTY